MPIIHVRNESSRNRYNRLLKKIPCITLFYADWCGHCQQLKPEWNKFEKLIRDSDVGDEIMIATVGEEERGYVSGDSDVIGYPSIFYLMDGIKQKEYSGPRNSEGLIEFLHTVRPELKDKLQEPSMKLLQMGGKRGKKNNKIHKITVKKIKNTKRTKRNNRRKTMKRNKKHMKRTKTKNNRRNNHKRKNHRK